METLAPMEPLSGTDKAAKPLKTRAESLHQFVLKTTAKEYRINAALIETGKNNHIVTEARMICVHLMYQYTNLSCRQLSKLYNLSKSQISCQIIQFRDYLKSPKYYKDLMLHYENVANLVAAQYNLLLAAEELAAQTAKSDKAERTMARENNRLVQQVLHTEKEVEQFNPAPGTEEPAPGDAPTASADANELNFTGEEPGEILEPPTLDDSPLDEPVINRNTEAGFSRLFNDQLPEAQVLEEKPKVIPASEPVAAMPVDVPVVGEAPTSDAPASDAPPMLDVPEEPVAADPGPMQFDPAPPAGNPETGYTIAPEQAKAIADFSTETIINLAKVAIPGITMRIVEVDEIRVNRMTEVLGEKANKMSVDQAKKMNTDHKATLEREVGAILPLMEAPLRQIVEVEKVKVTPGIALAFFGIWLAVVLWINIKKMAAEREIFFDRLEKVIARNTV